ncbi:MAG: 2-C-methyl-D-erythritol 4-phosphate cytidylyltransferase [Oscillospiraceae bacterium]
MNASVIIVSAGKSTRMNGIDKQFFNLRSIPVLIRSIKAFDSLDCVNEIIVVTSQDSFYETQKLLSEYSFFKKISLTVGGETRQQSVFKGIKLIDPLCDYIAVHDGARPLVLEKSILKAFEAAKKYEAAALGVPLKETVKKVSNGIVEQTLDRNGFVFVQTPQIFKKELYFLGMKNAVKNSLDFSDDCQLIEAVGGKIYITSGEYSNIKITTPEDLKIAEILLTEG